MFKKAVLFLTLLMFGALTRASDYDTAKSMCKSFSGKTIVTEVPAGVTIGLKNLYQGAKTALTLQGFGSSPEVKDLLGSPGYYKALKECFGDFDENRVAWDSFTLLIILSDATGQSFAYVGSTVLSAGVVAKSIQFVKYGFSLLRATPYLVANPQIANGIALVGKAISTGYIAKVGYDTFNDTLRPEIKTKKQILEKDIPNLQAANDEVLNLLLSEIQMEKKKPLKLRDNAKIEKLTDLYNTRKDHHNENIQRLKELATN